jgi:drug/metabolite transporter (DMT)-like permease
MSARHVVLIVFLAAIWGGAFTLIRNAVPTLGPLGLSAIRLALAAVIMLGYLQAKGVRVLWRRDWKPIGVIGGFGAALPFPLFAYGATQWPAGVCWR